MQLKERISDTVTDIRVHWNRPPYRRYIPYKEVFSYAVGGMGFTYINQFTATIGLSVGSFLVGSAIGIRPFHLQIMGIFSTILGFLLTMMRSYIIDNTKSKKGKYRPFILYMAAPTFLLCLLFVWMPYENMQYWQKIIAVFICYNAIQAVSPFFADSYSNLAYIMSPDSQERTTVISVSQIITSLAPSISNMLIPMLAANLTGGLNRIETYRFIYPAFSLLGLLLLYPAYGGTKERIIQARNHIAQIRFFDAIRAMSRNKYFWITSMAGWLGFLETAAMTIFSWTFVYAMPEKQELYGVFNVIVGNAALWALLLAPILIKKIGKRNLQIFCNLANVLFYAAMYPVFKNVWLLTIFVYLNTFANAFGNVYSPSIQADMRDYQQYLTGERIDGMFGTMGIIGSIVGMGTGLVLPAIYEKMGLRENYDVLYNDGLRNNLFRALIIASIIGSFLNFIPYLFYDLTEQKHDDMVKVLRIRALFEDYGNGILEDDQLADTIDLIEESNLLHAEQPVTLPKKDYIHRAIAEHPTGKERTLAVRAAKKEYRAQKKHNAQIASSQIVVGEMTKFSTTRIKEQVRRARELTRLGLAGMAQVDPQMYTLAKSMPAGTPEEKTIRADAVAFYKQWARSAKLMPKLFPNGITEPDPENMNRALALPDNTLQERLAQRKAIRTCAAENSRFRRVAKPYLDAKRLLQQEINYQKYAIIHENYDEARAKTDEKRRVEQEETLRLRDERKAELQRLRDERAKNKKK